MDPYSTPESILSRQFSASLSRGGNEGQRTAILSWSTSNFWTLHQHRDPHDKQLGNLMHLLGSSPVSKVLQLQGEILEHHCLFVCADVTLFNQNNSVPFLNAWNCCTPTELSCQVTRKTSRSSERYFRTTYGRHSKGLCRVSWSTGSTAGVARFRVFLRQHRTKPFIRSEEAECLQLESRTSTWKKRAPPRNELQENAALTPCHCRRCAVCFNKETISSTSKSNPFIYLNDTRLDLTDKVFGFYRTCFHVPLFVDNA